jgi:hypothetical protein
MVNSISSTHASQTNEDAKAAAATAKLQPNAQQKTTPQPSDTVTLKSTNAANQGGASK